MAEGRQESQWGQTAEVLAMLYNLNRDPKRSKPATARDFNPFAPKPAKLKAPIGILKKVFVDPYQKAAP